MYQSDSIKLTPSICSIDDAQLALDHHNPWFYNFRFQNGAATTVVNPLINTIHQTRADLIFPFLDEYFKDKWNQTRCVDIACNQGWFTTQLALRGASEVIGFDIRDQHIKAALTVKEISGLQNISYSQQNLFETDYKYLGHFDLTLLLGLLYHLENPIGALRKAKELTSNICIIETQVTRAMPAAEILNGSDTNSKYGASVGIFNSDIGHVEGGLPVVIVPTLDALYQMLYAVGFDRVYLAVPPQAMYPQYPTFDRVIIFAQVMKQS